jgi:hypothetical protein
MYSQPKTGGKMELLTGHPGHHLLGGNITKSGK